MYLLVFVSFNFRNVHPEKIPKRYIDTAFCTPYYLGPRSLMMFKF